MCLRRLERYCSKNEIISNIKYRFLKGNSTKLVVLNMTEKIKRNIEDKTLTMGSFVDLSEAFELINHCMSLNKLCLYGIKGVPLQLIEGYLSNREFVKI